MGTWGEGNFDNDAALDYLGELIHQFAATVEEILADAERARLDEEGEAILMPTVELMALLCERYNVAPPKETKVRQWRKKYLQIYDDQIDALNPAPGYKAQRRKVIENTFQWLESLAQSFWSK